MASVSKLTPVNCRRSKAIPTRTTCSHEARFLTLRLVAGAADDLSDQHELE